MTFRPPDSHQFLIWKCTSIARRISALSLLCVLMTGIAEAQNTDSLWNVYADKNNVDTVRMRALRTHAFSLIYTMPDSAFALYDTLYAMALADSNFRFLGYSSHDRSIVLKEQGQYSRAIEANFSAMKYWTREKFATGLASCQYNLANLYTLTAEWDKAYEQYINAASFYQQLKNKHALAGIYNDLGNMLRMKGGQDSLALVYLRQSLAFRHQLNYAQGIAGTSNNIAGVYYNMGQFDSALAYVDVYREHSYRTGNVGNIGKSLGNIGEIYIRMGRYYDAIDTCRKALKLSATEKLLREQLGACECLADAFEAVDRNDSALYYFKLGAVLQDTLDAMSREDEIARQEVSFQYEQKAIQDSLQNVEKERVEAERRTGEKNLRISLFVGLGLTLVFAAVMFNRFRVTRRQKNLIAEQNLRTEEQKKLIEEKNKEITDSINYAQRIQQAILPVESELKKSFADIFVLFCPRDIVSGDFYWYGESEHNKVIALADCTGHGVPGGFMSMLGFEILQDVVMLDEIKTTSEALNRLDAKVTGALNKNDRTYRDGMDMALCAFSKTRSTVQFSGANRSLLHVSQGEIKAYVPDKHTIGGSIDDTQKTFTHTDINVNTGDMIFLFSDGYADQFGGPQGKKFMSKKLEKLLREIAELSCAEQKDQLELQFKNWKGALEQVDDVCIIGIRV